MPDHRLATIPCPPRQIGLLGELAALSASLSAAHLPADLDVLTAVSGVAFSFELNSVFATEQNPDRPQFDWFIASPFDGPDPLRVAARFAGCDYTPHLVASLSTMIDRIVASIDAGFAVLTHHPAPPHPVTLVVGYRLSDHDAHDRAIDILDRDAPLVPVIEAEDEAAPEAAAGPVVKTVALPTDPSASWVEFGPWRNFVGVLSPRAPLTADSQRQQVVAALRRASAVYEGSRHRHGGYSALADAFATGHREAATVANDLRLLLAARTSAAKFFDACVRDYGLATAPVREQFAGVVAEIRAAIGWLTAGERDVAEIAAHLAALAARESAAVAAIQSVPLPTRDTRA